MRGVRRIADQYDVPMPPARILDAAKVDPRRLIRIKTAVLQIFSEQPLAVRNTFLFRGVIEPCFLPGLLVCFYDKRAVLLIKRIRMHHEESMLIFAEEKF